MASLAHETKIEDMVFFDEDKVKMLLQNPILLKFFDGKSELLKAYIDLELKE